MLRKMQTKELDEIACWIKKGAYVYMDQKQYFSLHLLHWYQQNHRELPWRQQKNPYYTWVSEIMLQQTKVDTVIPYFHRFIERFPTVHALADAEEEAVLKMWEGLGYYSRARNLQSAAKEVREKYDGHVPDNKKDVLSLKGIGSYTAGAILSIAYNQPEPAVDGNVMRVFSRYFNIQEDITKNSTKQRMEQLAEELIPEGAAGDFNQAIMELGALVCTPRSPQCLVCPVMMHCAARIEGIEETLPIKKKSKPPRPENRIVALIEGEGDMQGKLLIRQRPQDGLLSKMWELPHGLVFVPEGDWKAIGDDRNNQLLIHELANETGITLQPTGWFMDIQHTFSHIHWDMKVYVFKSSDEIMCSLEKEEYSGYDYRWVTLDEMSAYTFPTVFNRIIQAFQSNA